LADVSAASSVFESCSFFSCDATPTIIPESLVVTICRFHTKFPPVSLLCFH